MFIFFILQIWIQNCYTCNADIRQLLYERLTRMLRNIIKIINLIIKVIRLMFHKYKDN